ncbi:MAG: hypothetical protein V4858_25390, partial [Pseudomonadota bacterium]
ACEKPADAIKNIAASAYLLWARGLFLLINSAAVNGNKGDYLGSVEIGQSRPRTGQRDHLGHDEHALMMKDACKGFVTV